MQRADTEIKRVVPGSPADAAGIKAGDRLLTVNGRDFYDILEYRYLTAEYEVLLEVLKKDGSTDRVLIENDYEDLGIEFKTGLISQPQSCRNKCIFCFIDQLPKGMRETVYFKDDDTRLSFLQGNYVTLTNRTGEEIDRMIEMRISPINISVHTTNPALRERMLGNRFAGSIYSTMQKLAKNSIFMNCQIVLCPGFNDGPELDRTISDLAALSPYVESLSVVPVGLTRYREGLCKIKPFDGAMSAAVVRQVEAWQQKLLAEIGTRMVYLADEFYLNAGLDIPPAGAYEGFPQIENGVGLIASMAEEFDHGLDLIKPKQRSRKVLCATGELAYPFMKRLAERLEQRAPGVRLRVYAVKNDFFGGGVNVAGLVTGGDLIRRLQGEEAAEEVLIPSSMLRDGDDVFLDDVTVGQVEQALGMRVTPVNNDGYELIEKALGEELDFS